MKIVIDIDCQPTICGDCKFILGGEKHGFSCALFGWRTYSQLLEQTDTRCAKRCKVCLDRSVGQA